MTKTALGFSVTLVAGFCLCTGLIVNEDRSLAALRYYFAAGWATLALALGMIAFLRKRGHPRILSSAPHSSTTDAPGGDIEEHSVMFGPGYWSVMLALFAAISIFMIPWQKMPTKVRPPDNIAPRVPLTNQPAPPPEPRRDPFETVRGMHLRGISLHPTRPSAILDGRTYLLGDTVDGAMIVRITSSTVLFEKDGQTLELHLGQR